MSATLARVCAALVLGAVGPELAAAQADAAPAPPTAALERLPVAPPTARLRTAAAEALVGELRVPPGRGPFPVAIVLHGGCWLSRFADHRYMLPLAEALRADEGIATWTVRYRRVDEPGGGWPGTFEDLAAAADSVRALARRFPLDTTRVIAVGHSAGAPFAAWLAARPLMPDDEPDAAGLRGTAPLRVRGVVAVDGPVDLVPARALARPVCGADVLDRLVGAAPDARPSRWRAASAAAWLAPARAGVRQAVVVGGLDAGFSTPHAPAASLRDWARRSGAGVFVADTADHFSMLDPARPAWQATRDAVRHALGLPAEGRAGADRAALRAAYRTFAAGMHAREMAPALELLAPDFEHHALARGGRGPRVTPRAGFAERMTGAMGALDSLLAFTIDVTEVSVRGDSATVAYREHVDARWRPAQPGGAAVRDSSTTWWRDRWVRTAAGWRAVRFEEVPAPAARPSPRPTGRAGGRPLSAPRRPDR